MNKQAAAQQRLKERQAKKRFKLPEGDTTFRVLPNAKGADKSDYVEYAMHSSVGPKKAYMRCGKNIEGQGDCFICDKILAKLDLEKGSHKKAAEELARKEVFAVQIAVKEGNKWVGPQLWEMPKRVANDLLGIISKRDVTNPAKGYNLTINRTGTGMRDTQYSQIDRDDEPSPAPKDVLEKLKSFGEAIKKYDETQMKAAYYGHEQEEEPVVEDDALPVPDDDEAPKPLSPEEDLENADGLDKPLADFEEEVEGELEEEKIAELTDDGEVTPSEDEILEDLEEEPSPVAAKPNGKDKSHDEEGNEKQQRKGKQKVVDIKGKKSQPKAQAASAADDDSF